MTARKARRIWERTHGPGWRNWEVASAFVTGFYGHIIPAVMDRDRVSAQRVLEALSYAEDAPRHLAVNCFEAALAIYFLDAVLVHELWTARAPALAQAAGASTAIAHPYRPAAVCRDLVL